MKTSKQQRGAYFPKRCSCLVAFKHNHKGRVCVKRLGRLTSFQLAQAMQYFCWTFCQLGFALDNLADEARYVVPQWFAVGSGALPVAVREPLEGLQTPEAGQYVD